MNATPNASRESGAHRVSGTGRIHEWEIVSAFSLVLPKTPVPQEDCPLKPVMEELKPYGLEEPMLQEICHAVMLAGEDLRGCCPEGKLDCVSVRVNMRSAAMRGMSMPDAPWRFYLTRQMATSESDNLEALENPACFIDVFVEK